jgi:hypothetical protein
LQLKIKNYHIKYNGGNMNTKKLLSDLLRKEIETSIKEKREKKS